jgi:hypothetical protein
MCEPLSKEQDNHAIAAFANLVLFSWHTSLAALPGATERYETDTMKLQSGWHISEYDGGSYWRRTLVEIMHVLRKKNRKRLRFLTCPS